jgi:hypothetical protein
LLSFATGTTGARTLKHRTGSLQCGFSRLVSNKLLTSLLTLEYLEYYTFRLPFEKNNIVFRGEFLLMNIEEVKKELKYQDYHPTEVFRMRKYD